MSPLGSILQLIASPDSDVARYRAQNGGHGGSQQPPRHPKAGICFPSWQQGQDWERWPAVGRGTVRDLAPRIVSAASVHGEVGVLGLGTRFWGFTKWGHIICKVFWEAPNSCTCSTTTTTNLIQLRSGEWLPEPPPSSCRISPRAGSAEATQHPLHPSLPQPGVVPPASSTVPAPRWGFLPDPPTTTKGTTPVGTLCPIPPLRRCLTCSVVQGGGEEHG